MPKKMKRRCFLLVMILIFALIPSGCSENEEQLQEGLTDPDDNFSFVGYWVQLNDYDSYMNLYAGGKGDRDGSAVSYSFNENYFTIGNSWETMSARYWYQDKLLFLEDMDSGRVYIYVNIDNANQRDLDATLYRGGSEYMYGSWSSIDGNYRFKMYKNEDGEGIEYNLPIDEESRGDGYKYWSGYIEMKGKRQFDFYPINDNETYIFCYGDKDLYLMERENEG